MQKKQHTPCYSLITCAVLLFSQHVSAYADDVLIPATHSVVSDTNDINNTPANVESSSTNPVNINNVNTVHSPVFIENESSGTTSSNPDVATPSVKNSNISNISSDVIQSDSATALAPLHDIRPGQSSPLIKLLQQQQNMTPTGRYDDELVQWVKSEQESANMTANGIIDQRTWFLIFEQPATWQKNTSDEAQKQWASIVEKQSSNATGQFVVVNIPDMTLRAYSWDNTTHQATQLFTSKIIVGKPNSQTPLHDFFIWGIKYNPTWTPTSNMLKKNVFKNGAVNTAWLKQHGIRAVDSQGHVVPFSELSAQSSVHYMQPAGNSNALGVLKFETTSTEDIYLHDTNEKYHFNDNVRTFSSGCVRVQEYMQLAQWVSGLDEDTINHKLDNKQTRIEKIPVKVPVYFAYSQAWNDDGKTVFSPDPYHKENDISYKK